MRKRKSITELSREPGVGQTPEEAELWEHLREEKAGRISIFEAKARYL